MIKWLFAVVLIAGCKTKQGLPQTEVKDSTVVEHLFPVPPADTAITNKNILMEADSVVIASHPSPNEPLKDEKSGKWLPPFDITKNGKINTDVIVERKKISLQSRRSLTSILFQPAVQAETGKLCFQPRHAIFIFRNEEIFYLDICFDCGGVARFGRPFGSDLSFDEKKYTALRKFFRAQGLSYMLF